MEEKGILDKSQLMVAKALIEEGPMTFKQLQKKLGTDERRLEKALRGMLFLKAVERFGDAKKPKYKMAETVRRGVASRKREDGEEVEDDKYPFRAHIIVEGQSKSEEELKKANEMLLNKLKADKIVEVVNIEEEEIVKEEDTYSVLFEADISANEFADLVYVVLHYGPSSIEILQPSEFTLKIDEAQGLLMDVANIIHAYASFILKLQLKQ
jgi:hypothetical protein